jgi:hypothetical protein
MSRYQINSINSSIFGDYVKNINELYENSSDNKTLIKSNNEVINKFLSGGFHQGKIYELSGQSLSGKSYFINNLILYNLNTSAKILFIDLSASSLNMKLKNICEGGGNINSNISNNSTNINKTNNTGSSSKINTIDIKLTHITHITEFKELYLYLKSIQDDGYTYIFIDPLSFVLNRMLEKDDELIKEFNSLIIKLVKRYNIGLIYTTNVFKIKEKLLYDFTANINYFTKELDLPFPTNSMLMKDFTFTFYPMPFSYNKNGLRSRKIYLKIKKEKGVSEDIFIEIL